MNFPLTRASTAAAVAALAFVGALSAVSLPLATGLAVSAFAVAVSALVALAAQSGRFGEGETPVYRPVYVRRSIVQRRVRSEDE